MRKLGLAVLLVGVLGAPAAVAAQEPGTIGVTMGYPESLGMVWQVSSRVAVRPEISFSHVSFGADGPVSSNASSTTVIVGASALFYLTKIDSLRPYVTPRWTYSHTSPIGALNGGTNTLAGLFGAQYGLGQRFAVFGETGVEYSHASLKADIGVATVRQRTNGIRTRTGAGVIFYF